jgi:hypothetical protein
MSSPTRKTVLATLAIAGTLVAGAAHAGSDVYWSIGINAPIDRGVSVGTVISTGPVYGPPVAVVQPAPVVVYPQPVYAPPPVVYAPQPRVVYRPAPVYMPAPVVYAPPVYVQRPHRHGRKEWKHWDRDRDDRYYGRPVYRESPYRGEPIVYSPR